MISPRSPRVTPSLETSTASNFNCGGTVSSFNVAYTRDYMYALNATLASASATLNNCYQLFATANGQFVRFNAEL